MLRRGVGESQYGSPVETIALRRDLRVGRLNTRDDASSSIAQHVPGDADRRCECSAFLFFDGRAGITYDSVSGSPTGLDTFILGDFDAAVASGL
jgi:hypothetical protein